MNTSTSVSVGHGPGAPGNEGTAKDRSTPTPDSNLTEIDATQEQGSPDRVKNGRSNQDRSAKSESTPKALPE